MVVRKGATPAFPGQYGFVGGSMGDDEVILKGVSSEVSAQALYSTVHGAGRVMSRSAAKGKFVRDDKGKKQRQQGLVRHGEMHKSLIDTWLGGRRGKTWVTSIRPWRQTGHCHNEEPVSSS
jgi:tRNA-splicing ligase RtcB (3'-phosphate/5'-hydroxy nucleic acid ligase)